MRVAAVAAGSFAVPILESLGVGSHDLVGVVSRPDRPAGRRRIPAPCPVASWARTAGVRLLTPPRVSDPAFEPAFRSLGAEVAVVVDFGEILKPFVFEWVPHGFLGVHPSLLPRWRGAAPIQWSILAGDETTGISVFRLSAAIDAGHLALRVPIAIEARETAPELERRLGRESARALDTVLRRLQERTLTFVPQPAEGASLAPKLRRADGVLRWHEECRSLDRRVRALVPWPCAWFASELGAIKVTRAYPNDLEHGHQPGTVLGLGHAAEEEGVRIACGRGELVLLEVQRPGRRPLDAVSWFRGARLSQGTVLPDPGEGAA